ncbi:zinc-ribbon domain-containing protein [Dyella sp. RRB7]|uniref:zinc-ribbon domain-containing protein n=1 Tax=Dyella sp. RRB7 TaxID=2919502 RepID=UPI001FAA611A|nr:zinc-ribbon domain-containing protein [Dyella sp. RRB7]
MALIKCPDCGTDVSDAAPACPKCGRPIAVTPSSFKVAADREEKKRSSSVSITLSSFAVLVIGLVLGVCFVPALQIGQHVEARCQVNGLGHGQCQFTNTGWTPGSQCVVVKLVNQTGGSANSGPLCSGRVWPNDTAQRDVSIAVGKTCEAPGSSWSDVCSMDIVNVGESDGSAQADSRPPYEEPTAGAQSKAATDSGLTGAHQGPAAPQVAVADPFDANAVLRQLPPGVNGDGKPVRPELVYTSAPYAVGSSSSRFVLVSYALSGDCHACGVSLSSAVLTKQQGNWVMTSWSDAITTFGAYGKLGGTAELFPLGSHPAVFLSATDIGQGVVDSYGSLIADVNGSVAVVWNGPTSTDATGSGYCEKDKCSNWKGELHAIEASHEGWPNLEFRSAGVNAKDDGSMESMDRTQLLQFDGAKYGVASTVPAPVNPGPTSDREGAASGQPSTSGCTSVADCSK